MGVLGKHWKREAVPIDTSFPDQNEQRKNFILSLKIFGRCKFHVLGIKNRKWLARTGIEEWLLGIQRLGDEGCERMGDLGLQDRHARSPRNSHKALREQRGNQSIGLYLVLVERRLATRR